MPEKKSTEKKEYVCKYCGKDFLKLSSKTNHQKSCENNPNSPKTKQKIETKEEVLHNIMELKATGQLKPEEEERLNLVESKLINQTEDHKIKEQKEEEIQEMRQDSRAKRAVVDNIMLDTKLSNLQDQNPNQINIKDLIDIKKLETFGGSNKQDNIMPQFFQMQLQQQDKAHEREMELRREIEEVRRESSKKNENILSQIKDFHEITDSIAKSAGYVKSDDENMSSAKYISQMIGGLMDKYGKDLIQLGKQRMQSEQDQITNIEYPEHPIETTENLVESLNEEVQEQIIPTPTPQLNDEQIESYARTHDLSEQDISINPDSVNESIDQYLHVGKFRSTAPVTPMV